KSKIMNIDPLLLNWIIIVTCAFLCFAAIGANFKSQLVRSLSSLVIVVSIVVLVLANFFNLGNPYPVIYDVLGKDEKGKIIAYDLKKDVGIFYFIRREGDKAPIYIVRPWS